MTTTCNVCPFFCELAPGEIGKCRARANKDNRIVPLSYGRASTVEVGPIEQKPIYHFHPGMQVLSIGGAGCNMFCKYCQNFEVSQSGRPPMMGLSPGDAVATALKESVGGIAFTYNEPLVQHEYVTKTAMFARMKGLKTILKTNGFANLSVFKYVCSKIDAVNVDIKGGPRMYREICRIDLPDTFLHWLLMDNLIAAQEACHLELSIIVIPGYDDEIEEVLKGLPIRRSTPLHFLKFVPDFRMRDHNSPTNEQMHATVAMARKMGFQHAYIDYAGVDAITQCPECSTELVVRSGIKVISNFVSDGRCPSCAHGIPDFIS